MRFLKAIRKGKMKWFGNLMIGNSLMTNAVEGALDGKRESENSFQLADNIRINFKNMRGIPETMEGQNIRRPAETQNDLQYE